MAILDMGVGGGRTTQYLSQIAGRYVGADYSEAMVDTCRKRFPDQEFRHCDARDIAPFADGEFDAVVFSANGIDYIAADEGRARCLAEWCELSNVAESSFFLPITRECSLCGQCSRMRTCIRCSGAFCAAYANPWSLPRDT